MSEKFETDYLKLFSGMPNYLTQQILQKIEKELNFKNKMTLIEDMLNQILMIEVKNTLVGYPFTIGIVIAYLLLKRIEIKNLVSLLNLKYYEIL